MANYKATENGECIFCKIAKGEIEPIGKGTFWENEKFMAWLSPFPNTEGFSLVIPKKHYGSDVLAMPESDLFEFISAAKEVAQILTNHFADVGRVGLIMEGTGIDHAHIKLFPMHGTGYMKKGEWRQCHSGNDKYFESYEGYIASNDGPQADEKGIGELAKKLKIIKH